MLGVTINNLNELREQDYHFVENEAGDLLRVEKGKDILQTVSLMSNGQLDVKDEHGDRIGIFNSVQYSMRHTGARSLCISFS
mgnify:CR=1 FL=1